MADELQEIVDLLGAELGCAVAVDDDRMELLAYSPHSGPLDDVRRSSILRRTSDPDVVAYVSRFDIRHARHAVRIPANPDLAMMARVCITLWYKQERLGYLWIIDPEPPLNDAQIARAERAAADIAAVLSEERWRTEVQRGRERELVRDLLSADAALRAHAASELVQTGTVSSGQGAQAIVVRLAGEKAEFSELGRRQFDTALREVRRRLPAGAALHLAHPDHGLLLLLGKVKDQTVKEACGRLMDEAASEEGRVVVGIGTIRPTLGEARDSYEQAMLATEVAHVVPTVGRVVRWSELGVYRVLAQLPRQELAAEALDPRLLALFAADPEGTLTHTLETYLECGGDTRRTIDRLILHRTSLYYRLEKIAKLTGLDVDDGDDRLAMHLGLKIARLAGVHPNVDDDDARQADRDVN